MKDVDMKSYIVKLFLSSVLAALSLIGDRMEGLLGAMVISPFIVPIMMVTTDVEVGLPLLIFSVAFCILVGFLTDKIFDRKLSQTGEIIKRSAEINVVDEFIVSFVIGAAIVMGQSGTLGFGTSELVGAGIAITLLPPLVNTGILYSKRMYKNAKNALKITIMNILGVLAAIMLLEKGDIHL